MRLRNFWLFNFSLLFLALATQAYAFRAAPDPILEGTIDTHVHTGLEMLLVGGVPINEIELARIARAKGIRALVYKPLLFESINRSFLVSQMVPGIDIIGGLMMGNAVGCMNPAAVAAAGSLGEGPKVVWMPVEDAENQIDFFHIKGSTPCRISDGKKLFPQTLAVIDAIKKYDMVLATGHVSGAEAMMLARAARQRHLNIIMTHAIQDPIDMSLPEVMEAIKLGAWIEFTVLGELKGPTSHLGEFFQRQKRFTIEMQARFISEVIRGGGANKVVLATDLGQFWDPLQPDGYKAFVIGLKKYGISERDIDLMTRKNAAQYLNLHETVPSSIWRQD